MTTLYYIAPVTDPKDMYEAGYDGNLFSSEADAEAAIPGLAEATKSTEDDWMVETISADHTVAKNHARYSTVMAEVAKA